MTIFKAQTITGLSKKIKPLAWSLFILYLLFVIKMILFKGSIEYILEHFNEKYSYELVGKKIKGANFYPFSTIYYYLSGQDSTGSWQNILGNIFLFMPLGFFLPMLIEKIQTLKQIALIAFIISLCLETIQLLIAYGSFDIDDSILNTFGTIIGYLGFNVLRHILPKISIQKKEIIKP